MKVGKICCISYAHPLESFDLSATKTASTNADAILATVKYSQDAYSRDDCGGGCYNDVNNFTVFELMSKEKLFSFLFLLVF